MLYQFILWNQASNYSYKRITIQYYGTPKFADSVFIMNKANLEIKRTMTKYNEAIVNQFLSCHSIPLELKALITKFATTEPI